MQDIFLVGHRPPVLLLHGLRSNPLELQLVAQRLHRAGHTVSVPYLRGYGQRPGDCSPVLAWRQWEHLAGERLAALVADYGPATVGGLCIGANLALRLARRDKAGVTGLLLISTTLYYDGWNQPWYSWLVPLAGATPLRHFYRVQEKEPYGVKNPRIRSWIARQMASSGSSAAGARELPLSAVHEAYRLMRRVKANLPEITQPALILHAAEDEIASLRTPELLAGRLGSSVIEKIIYTNSYHMLTLDNDREDVARACVEFVGELERKMPVAARLPIAV